MVLKLFLQLENVQLEVGVSAGLVGTVVTAHLSEVRQLLVDRFLDGPQIEGAELGWPVLSQLVDRHTLALERVYLIVSHVEV